MALHIPLLPRLISQAVGVAELLAGQLVVGVDERGSSIGWDAPTEETFRELGGRFPELGSPARLAHRAQQVLRLAGSIDGRVATNPFATDLLDLTCKFLSAPAFPSTERIVRFAVVLALRALYRVRYSRADIDELRSAHSLLSGRFDSQQAKRERKEATRHERLLIDVLALIGSIRRGLSGANLLAYLAGFKTAPLGVRELPDGEPRRAFAEEPHWHQLHGGIPSFPTLVTLMFAQPTAIDGLDPVLGGFLPGVGMNDESNGQVTLIAGGPGTGKTTLCLALASRAAELGSVVRYVTTEESRASLETKLATSGSLTTLSKSFFGDDNFPPTGADFKIVEGHAFKTLQQLGENLLAEVRAATGFHAANLLEMPCKRIVFIDSLTTLLAHTRYDDVLSPSTRSASLLEAMSVLANREHNILQDRVVGLLQSELSDALRAEARSPNEDDGLRRKTANLLLELRSAGVSVFLVGDESAICDSGLAYLVDNVLVSGVEDSIEGHPIRYLDVAKTRLQVSHRGRHVLHLSRRDGCTVSPSLHAVIRALGERVLPAAHTGAFRQAAIWVPSDRQLLIPGVDERVDRVSDREARGLQLEKQTIMVPDGARVLIYGPGSTGKGRFAMMLALAPQVPKGAHWTSHLKHIARNERPRRTTLRSWLREARVLVVSFLYESGYYRRIIRDLATRIGYGPVSWSDWASDSLHVLDFYPGFIDAETVLARIGRELRSARLEGRPYTSVVLDGAHNVLLQYPRLERERLLWPALYRLLKSERVTTISTFTFFSPDPGLIETAEAGSGRRRDTDAGEGVWTRRTLSVSKDVFFHLLISSTDYSFRLVRKTKPRDAVEVQLSSAIDGFQLRPRSVTWMPGDFTWHGTPQY